MNQSSLKKLSSKKKEQIKSKAISDLFKSAIIQEKIQGMNYRYGLPMEADIQSDVLQHTFELLSKYNTDKFVEAYLDNPKRIIGLATKICYTRCYNKKKNVPKNWTGLAHSICHASTLNTKYHIITTYDLDDDQKFTVPFLQQLTTEDISHEEIEQENLMMWKYVMKHLDENEVELLNLHLNNHIKIKKKDKQQFDSLLDKIKPLIIEFKNRN